MDDIKTFGLYVASYNVSNKPSAFNSVPCYVSVEDYIIDNHHVVKQVASRAGYPSYTRIFSDNTWNNWKVVYDENILTDSTILSSLASALFSKGGLPSNGDANLLTDTGFYSFSGGDTMESAHLPTGYCFLLNLKTGGYFPYLQICASYSGSEMWTRAKDTDGTWHNWRKVKFEA